MDLLTCLPATKSGSDTIIVRVDRFTKYVMGVPAKLTIDALGFAQLMLKHVITKIEVPASIVSDKDVRFTTFSFKTIAFALGSSPH